MNLRACELYTRISATACQPKIFSDGARYQTKWSKRTQSHFLGAGGELDAFMVRIYITNPEEPQFKEFSVLMQFQLGTISFTPGFQPGDERRLSQPRERAGIASHLAEARCD